MKHRVKVDVVTRKRGLFGIRDVVRKRTITVSGKDGDGMKRRKWNSPVSSEEERLAALYLMWEETADEMAGVDKYGD